MEEMHIRRRRRKRKNRLPHLLALLTVLLVTAGLIAAAAMRSADQPEPERKLELSLIGDAEITLEYGEAWTDAGVRASIDGEKVDAEIETHTPDMDRLGIYTVRYTATFEDKTATAKRTVRVVDTQLPVITLLEDPGYSPEFGESYKEEGYLAQDNYDGDLTAKVERRQEGDTVYYTVTDSAGNTATAERKVVFVDRTPPVITLQGENTVTITAGTAFEDPGVTAADKVDGDLTGTVTVSGEYDIYVPGTYTLTYTVTDSAGNTAQAVRTLVVEGVQPPPVVQPDEKVIYLTFDDGPSANTPRLLEILDKYDVKVTFFVVGSQRLEYLDDIVAAGHSIGIHTDTHDYSQIYASEDAFFEDFYAVHAKILQHTGIDTTLSRFPGGSSNKESMKYCLGIMTKLTKAVEALGFQYFDWNVDSKDAAGAKTADEVYRNVISGIGSKENAVVLQHDRHAFSVDAVERIIQWGLANGYTFRALDATSPTAHHNPINN